MIVFLRKFFISSVIALGLVTGFAMAGSPALADVNIKRDEQTWQVDASNEPLSRVLKELVRQTGVKLSGTEKLIEDPLITGSYSGSADTVLRRVLRGVDYAAETATDKYGETRIVRIVVLSGELGQAPSARSVRAAKKLPVPASPAEIAVSKKEGQRVTALLETKARVAAGTQPVAEAPVASAASAGSGITRNEDGTYDIDPETQARMAEATRRAQADLQALVNALRRNEEAGAN